MTRSGNSAADIVEGRWFLQAFLFALLSLAAAMAIARAEFSDRQPFRAPGELHASFVGFESGALLSGAPTNNAEGGPAQPASGGGGASEANAVERYFAQVLQKVNRQKRYPRREEEERIEGEALVRLTVNRQGKLIQADLLQASPRAGFNREALASVRRANPFPEFPAEVMRDALTFDLRVQFKLN